MKHLSAVILLVLIPLLTCRAAEKQPAVPAEIIRGNVRMVLMSVGQTTIFLNSPTQPNPQSKWPAPCFTVTYLLELLGDQPFKTTQLAGLEVTAGGKPFEPVNFAHGHYHKTFDYKAYPDFLDFTKPKVTNQARAFIFQDVTFAAVPSLEPFDLVIRGGFDQDVQEFKFPVITLRPPGDPIQYR